MNRNPNSDLPKEWIMGRRHARWEPRSAARKATLPPRPRAADVGWHEASVWGSGPLSYLLELVVDVLITVTFI
jgi:hypothetical protein